MSKKAPLALTKKTLPKEAIEAIRKANTEAGNAKIEYANLCVQEQHANVQLTQIVAARDAAMTRIIAANDALTQAADAASKSVGVDTKNETWTIQVDTGTIERVR